MTKQYIKNYLENKGFTVSESRQTGTFVAESETRNFIASSLNGLYDLIKNSK